MSKLIFLVLCVAFLSSCACPPQGSIPAAEPDTLIWYLPAGEKYAGTQDVTAEVNRIIQKTYPDIRVDFRFINLYEYADKVSLYLSSGEQMDIVWASDKILPFIQYPYNSIYKFLDAPIKSNAPGIYARLKDEEDTAYRIFDKNYYIPMIGKTDGLIPFLKIPRELAGYMDIPAFMDAVQTNDTVSSALFACIDAYLQKLEDAGELRDGVDLARVYDIFPQIGYETFISTSSLLGCRISDPNSIALDMLNTPSTLLSYQMYADWHARQYIRDDTPITYKSSSSSAYRYVLSGTWGYVDETSLSLVLDQNTDDYIYLAADRYYHKTKSFTDSVALIPTRSRHLDKALKLLDLFYQDSRLYELLTFGIGAAEYRCFENIVPCNQDIHKAVPIENVFMVQMYPGAGNTGMFIPAVSTRFRQTLLDYTKTYAPPPYSITLPDNSGSAAEYLVRVYNGDIADEN